MKTLKKTLCLVLAVVMAVGVLVLPANAAELTDADEITHDEAVAVLNGLGIVNGDENGNFNPEKQISRAEAAVLLAQVVLTPEDAALLTANSKIFTDVPADHYAGKYITWAVENDYIHGVGDNKFEPDRKLTGLELAALMLEVLGETLDSANLQNFVALKTKEYGLSDGITGYSASKAINRDDAVQMMFNAMKYSPNGSVVYDVYDASKKYVTTCDNVRDAALLVAVLGEGATFEDNTVGTDNILNNTYNVTHNTKNEDIFGRPTTTWTKDAGEKTEEDLYLEENAPVKGPVYTQTTVGELFKDELKKGDVKAKLFVDGVQVTFQNKTEHSGISTLDSTTTTYTIGGQGSETTVYKNDDVYEVYVVTTKTKAVSADDAKAGAVELYAKSGDVAAQKYEDSTLTAGDVIIYQGTATTLYKAQKAEVLNGRIIEKSTSADKYFKVESHKTYVSDAYMFGETNKTTADVFAKEVNVSKDTVYNVWTDFQGNAVKIAVDTGEAPVTAAPNYVYVIEFAANPGTSGSLTGNTPAYALARLYNLSTGEITDENVAIAQKSGKWYYANKDGEATDKPVEASKRFTAPAFATYELTKDGEYVLTEITDSKTVITGTSIKNEAKKAVVEVGGKTYYANSSSKMVFINGTGTTVSDYKAPVENVGYTKFVGIDKSKDVNVLLLLNSSNAIDTVYVVGDKVFTSETKAETKDFAIFMSKGATVLEGTPYTFLIEGKTETYYSDKADIEVKEGGLYKLTFSTENPSLLASADAAKDGVTTEEEVTIKTVSTGYIIVTKKSAESDDVVYLTDTCMFYNVTDHAAVESLTIPADKTVTATLYTVNDSSAANNGYAFAIAYTVA